MKILSQCNLAFWRQVSAHVKQCNRFFAVYLCETEKFGHHDSQGSLSLQLLAKVNNHVSFGHGYMVASTNERSLLVSGVNSASQLGIPLTEISYISSMQEIKLPFTNNNGRILDISCGRLHTMVLSNQELFASGCNSLGQCGLGQLKETSRFTKIPWSYESPIKQVVCGLDHSLVLTSDGSVWSCGWGADGQTGLGLTGEQKTFAHVATLKNVEIRKLACKADTSLALTSCGDVYAWGNSEYGQVGFATDKTLISEPTKIIGLKNIVDICIAGSVALALTEKGKVLTWGFGLLGNSPDVCYSAVPQPLVSIENDATSIDCGLDFYIIRTVDKEMYAWGRIGRNNFIRTPEQTPFPWRVVRTSCGVDQMAFITEE